MPDNNPGLNIYSTVSLLLLGGWLASLINGFEPIDRSSLVYHNATTNMARTTHNAYHHNPAPSGWTAFFWSRPISYTLDSMFGSYNLGTLSQTARECINTIFDSNRTLESFNDNPLTNADTISWDRHNRPLNNNGHSLSAIIACCNNFLPASQNETPELTDQSVPFGPHEPSMDFTSYVLVMFSVSSVVMALYYWYEALAEDRRHDRSDTPIAADDQVDFYSRPFYRFEMENQAVNDIKPAVDRLLKEDTDETTVLEDLTQMTAKDHLNTAERNHLLDNFEPIFHTLIPRLQNDRQKAELERKFNQLKAVYQCPITFELTPRRVVASDGHTYDYHAINQWLTSTDIAISPITREPLTTTELFENFESIKRLEHKVLALVDKLNHMLYEQYRYRTLPAHDS